MGTSPAPFLGDGSIPTSRRTLNDVLARSHMTVERSPCRAATLAATFGTPQTVAWRAESDGGEMRSRAMSTLSTKSEYWQDGQGDDETHVLVEHGPVATNKPMKTVRFDTGPQRPSTLLDTASDLIRRSRLMSIASNASEIWDTGSSELTV